MSGNRKQQEDIVFRSLLEVWKWLKAQGWHVSKSGIYKHREKGLIKAGDGGYYHLKNVKKYIRLAGLQKSPLTAKGLYNPFEKDTEDEETPRQGPEDEEAPSSNYQNSGVPLLEEIELLQARKLQAETRIQQLREQKLRLELERERGKWISREDMVREIVSRAIAMDAFVRQRVLVKAPELILAVSGDSSRAREFLAVFEEIWEEALNDFARQDLFKVLNIDVKEEKKQANGGGS